LAIFFAASSASQVEKTSLAGEGSITDWKELPWAVKKLAKA